MWQLATEGLTLINTEAGALNKNNFQGMIRIEATLFNVKKSYRCPKFNGDAKQTLEIRVERKQNNHSSNLS